MFASGFAGGDALVFHFFLSDVSLGSLRIIVAVIIFIIVLPRRMIFLPFVVDGGLVNGGIFEGVRSGGWGGLRLILGLLISLILRNTVRFGTERGLVGCARAQIGGSRLDSFFFTSTQKDIF